MTSVRQLLEGKGRQVFSVGPQAPVLEAIRLMAEHHIGALLVMKGEALAGVVSERDYALKVILPQRAADTPASGTQLLHDECVRLDLVPDAANHFLKNIFHRHNAGRAAEFIEHDGQAPLLALQTFQQLQQVHALRHK